MFRNFSYVDYLFGDEINPSVMQNLTTYIDLIDQVKDDVSFYDIFEIPDGYRSDTLSQYLYGNTEYYWMFYLLNDNLRVQGWPLDSQDVYAAAKEYYPNTTFITNFSMHSEFFIGDIICAQDEREDAAITFNNPTFKGRIIEKNYDLGQIQVKPIRELRTITVTEGGSDYTVAPTVTITGGGGTGSIAQAILTDGVVSAIIVTEGGEEYTSTPTITLSSPELPRGIQATATANISSNSIFNRTTVYSQKNQPNNLLWDLDDIDALFVRSTRNQWDAPHHYEDANGEYVDLPIEPATGMGVANSLPTETPITNLDRLIAENDKLKQIKIFRPDIASQINAEYQKLLRQ